jgi:malonyl CoA-acyl carrier protein transacylase/thioesterase domain-containing protein/acyl carrier protein
MKRLTVQDKLSESFKKYKDNTALKKGEKKITYAGLDAKSTRISNWIRGSGIKKGSFIGLHIEDRIDCITALLGILKAGCVFVPMEIPAKLNRITKMLELTGTKIVCCDPEAQRAYNINMPVRTVLFEDLLYHEQKHGQETVEYDREDIVYVEFKQEPSGLLNGVPGKNKSLLHLVEWEIETHGIDTTSRVSQVSSPGSGYFLMEVLPALCSGARVCIYPGSGGPFVFMFSGLGSQYVDMGLGLYRADPLFREEMDRCFEILEPITGYDPKEILYPSPGSNRSDSKKINRVEMAQLVIFIFEYALARRLIKLGIKPRAMIGYSFGEYTAACLAGVFLLEDALRLIAARGRLLKQLPPGSMTSIPLPKDRLQELLPPGISIAIDNGPSCIAAGPVEAVKQFEKKMRERKLLTMPLKSTRAVHSAMMEPILEKFEKEVGRLTLQRPKIPFISNVTGDWITDREAIDPTYWVNQLRAPVLFADGIKTLLEKTGAIFVEIGPGSDLSALLRYHTNKGRENKVIPLVRNPNKKVSDMDFFRHALSHLEPPAGNRVTQWIEQNRIRLFHCNPYLFHMINSGTLKSGYFKHLTHVLLLGGTVDPDDLKRWFDIFGERIQPVYLYGAPEITMVKMYYNIRANDAEKETIPIGKPIKGARAIVLDKSMNICDRGITGDIYIRTPYRSAGYCGNPQLTARRFVPNPFNTTNDPNDLIYKTGDTGKLLPDGNIERVGKPGQPVTVGKKDKIRVEYKGPANEIERKLAAIWCKILKKEKIGIRDDFFEAGGHSLGMMTLAAEIYQIFNVEMTVPQLFTIPRIEDISKYIMGTRDRLPGTRDMEVPYMVFNESKPRKIFLFPPKIAYGMEYKELSKHVTGYSFIAFNYIEEDGCIEQYVDLIKGIRTRGPYIFLGYSAGGNLAFEVVKAMEKTGNHSIELIMMDSYTNREIEGLTSPDQQENYLKFVIKNLEARGLSFLKENVTRKIKKYGSYLDNLETNGSVKAAIHFITANNRKIARDWEQLTTDTFKIYRGFGTHLQMLDPGILEKNAKMINKILTEINR